MTTKRVTSLSDLDGLELYNEGTKHTLRFMFENGAEAPSIAIDLLADHPDPEVPDIPETLECWYINDAYKR